MARIDKLSELLAALSTRETGQMEAARLLQCSPTCARNYLRELADAGLIVRTRQFGRRPRGEPLFRLSADPRTVDEYKALLANPGGRAGSRESLFRRGLPDGRGPHRPCLSIIAENAMPVTFPLVGRRDPLVAALFGAATPTRFPVIGSAAPVKSGGNDRDVG